MDSRGGLGARACRELPPYRSFPARLVRSLAPSTSGRRPSLAGPARARVARGARLVARHGRLLALPSGPRTSRRGAARRRGAHRRGGLDVWRSLPRRARAGLWVAAAPALARDTRSLGAPRAAQNPGARLRAFPVLAAGDTPPVLTVVSGHNLARDPLGEYLAASAAAEPAPLTIWPEAAVPGYLADEPRTAEAIARAARARGWLLLGTPR